MSNVYSAYGPMPTSVGVTAAPRINGSLDRRAIQMGRSATLGRNNVMPMPRYPTHDLGCSYQDLRRSREYLDHFHQGTMEPLQSLDSLSVGTGRHMGSLDTFPEYQTSTLERRRNGGVATACSVHGGGGTLSRGGSRRESRYTLSEETHSGGCGRSCCSITLSILACLLILSGVIVALYFFIKNVPYETRTPIQEEPCERQPCDWWGECRPDHAGGAVCVCPSHCPPPSSTASPICGTDGVTYLTLCELRRIACSAKQSTRIQHSGSCDEVETREGDTGGGGEGEEDDEDDEGEGGGEEEEGEEGEEEEGVEGEEDSGSQAKHQVASKDSSTTSTSTTGHHSSTTSTSPTVTKSTTTTDDRTPSDNPDDPN